MKDIIYELECEIKRLFTDESSGHDIFHLKRVLNLANSLQKKEGGDAIVISVSAFLHDVHRIIQKQSGKYCSPRDSLPTIEKILDKTQIELAKKEKILHCIEFHEEYNFSIFGKSVNDIETLILQDADNLDAIGALGIGRTFAYGGAYGTPMWLPDQPFNRENFDENEEDPSTIHHFYSKLLKLKINMNTESAKILANERHEFMELYLQRFFDEWNGVK